ncbi:hypothetical protein PMAYCL1PPCAC_33319, partial [Pristionchus mayeri]
PSRSTDYHPLDHSVVYQENNERTEDRGHHHRTQLGTVPRRLFRGGTWLSVAAQYSRQVHEFPLPLPGSPEWRHDLLLRLDRRVHGHQQADEIQWSPPVSMVRQRVHEPSLQNIPASSSGLGLVIYPTLDIERQHRQQIGGAGERRHYLQSAQVWGSAGLARLLLPSWMPHTSSSSTPIPLPGSTTLIRSTSSARTNQCTKDDTLPRARREV